MKEEINFYKKSGNYRIWIDDTGVGHIRVIKRINFKVLVDIFEELHHRIKNTNRNVNIKFYIAKSLYDEMSTNSKEFLEFCKICVGVNFELILLEIPIKE